MRSESVVYMKGMEHLLFLSIPTEPGLHVACTSVGFVVGYLAHSYEERSEERTERLLEKYKHAPREWVEMTSKKQ